MIEFRSVQKIYNHKDVALKNASFSVGTGEFVFIVGASGAGKTTLLKLIYKAEEISNGDIFIFRRNIKTISKKILRRNIGIVFQDFNLLHNKTTLENVSYVLESLGKGPVYTKTKALEALGKLGIEHLAHKYPREVSGGEQQRIVIARAIVNAPQIIICDEPTGNLDDENAAIVMHYLQELNDQGSTIIVCTHDKRMVETMQKRVLLVKDGRVVDQAVKQEFDLSHFVDPPNFGNRA